MALIAHACENLLHHYEVARSNVRACARVRVCVCACVFVCVRARVCARVLVCVREREKVAKWKVFVGGAETDYVVPLGMKALSRQIFVVGYLQFVEIESLHAALCSNGYGIANSIARSEPNGTR